MTEDEELHKPYFDVKPFYYFLDRARLQKKIERHFGYTPKPEPVEEKPYKVSKWFVVVESTWDGDTIYPFHTKKEALAELRKHKKIGDSCYLIKGKIV